MVLIRRPRGQRLDQAKAHRTQPSSWLVSSAGVATRQLSQPIAVCEHAVAVADEEEAGAGLVDPPVVVAPPREQEVLLFVLVAGSAVAADGRAAPGEEAGPALARRAGALLRPPLLLMRHRPTYIAHALHLRMRSVRDDDSVSFSSAVGQWLLPCALNLFPLFVSVWGATCRCTRVVCI